MKKLLLVIATKEDSVRVKADRLNIENEEENLKSDRYFAIRSLYGKQSQILSVELEDNVMSEIVDYAKIAFA